MTRAKTTGLLVVMVVLSLTMLVSGYKQKKLDQSLSVSELEGRKALTSLNTIKDFTVRQDARYFTVYTKVSKPQWKKNVIPRNSPLGRHLEGITKSHLCNFVMTPTGLQTDCIGDAGRRMKGFIKPTRDLSKILVAISENPWALRQNFLIAAGKISLRELLEQPLHLRVDAKHIIFVVRKDNGFQTIRALRSDPDIEALVDALGLVPDLKTGKVIKKDFTLRVRQVNSRNIEKNSVVELTKKVKTAIEGMLNRRARFIYSEMRIIGDGQCLRVFGKIYQPGGKSFYKPFRSFCTKREMKAIRQRLFDNLRIREAFVVISEDKVRAQIITARGRVARLIHPLPVNTLDFLGTLTELSHWRVRKLYREAHRIFVREGISLQKLSWARVFFLKTDETLFLLWEQERGGSIIMKFRTNSMGYKRLVRVFGEFPLWKGVKVEGGGDNMRVTKKNNGKIVTTTVKLDERNRKRLEKALSRQFVRIPARTIVEWDDARDCIHVMQIIARTKTFVKELCQNEKDVVNRHLVGNHSCKEIRVRRRGEQFEVRCVGYDSSKLNFNREINPELFRVLHLVYGYGYNRELSQMSETMQWYDQSLSVTDQTLTETEFVITKIEERKWALWIYNQGELTSFHSNITFWVQKRLLNLFGAQPDVVRMSVTPSGKEYIIQLFTPTHVRSARRKITSAHLKVLDYIIKDGHKSVYPNHILVKKQGQCISLYRGRMFTIYKHFCEMEKVKALKLFLDWHGSDKKYFTVEMGSPLVNIGKWRGKTQAESKKSSVVGLAFWAVNILREGSAPPLPGIKDPESDGPLPSAGPFPTQAPSPFKKGKIIMLRTRTFVYMVLYWRWRRVMFRFAYTSFFVRWFLKKLQSTLDVADRLVIVGLGKKQRVTKVDFKGLSSSKEVTIHTQTVMQTLLNYPAYLLPKQIGFKYDKQCINMYTFNSFGNRRIQNIVCLREGEELKQAIGHRFKRGTIAFEGSNMDIRGFTKNGTKEHKTKKTSLRLWYAGSQLMVLYKHAFEIHATLNDNYFIYYYNNAGEKFFFSFEKDSELGQRFRHFFKLYYVDHWIHIVGKWLVVKRNHGTMWTTHYNHNSGDGAMLLRELLKGRTLYRIPEIIKFEAKGKNGCIDLHQHQEGQWHAYKTICGKQIDELSETLKQLHSGTLRVNKNNLMVEGWRQNGDFAESVSTISFEDIKILSNDVETTAPELPRGHPEDPLISILTRGCIVVERRGRRVYYRYAEPKDSKQIEVPSDSPLSKQIIEYAGQFGWKQDAKLCRQGDKIQVVSDSYTPKNCKGKHCSKGDYS